MVKKFGRCFRCFTPDSCPLHRLEVEKIIYAILLVISIAMLVVCTWLR